MLFTQHPPELTNQYTEDWLLRGLLARLMPAGRLEALGPELDEMGEMAGGKFYSMQLADRLNEPRLIRWDAWGNRIDRIELTRVWREAEPVAARFGLVGRGYESARGEFARLEQFALAYLFIPSTDFFGCPLAMTDGAARILADSGNQALAERALGRLTSRAPETFWTSGQWMTETPGGSDVGNTETVARQDETGQWRLHGRKWFTSAATSQMALTLARPEGAPDGSKGLALFYIEPRDSAGRLQNIEILRLKDKLGTRKLPTAELMLNGAPAVPVSGLDLGVSGIAPMLNITRTWNAVTACSLMTRGLALAGDYARKRRAFGKYLIDHPLHRTTLARLAARRAVATCIVFEQIHLLGQVENDIAGADRDLLRLLIPVNKLATAREAIDISSEVLEAFGGAGYVEDTGLPMLLRDSQVLSIWEGTTNVLSLDLLRALAATGPDPWFNAVDRALENVTYPELIPVAETARTRARNTRQWLKANATNLEPSARDLALAFYDTLALALITRHAQWAIETQNDHRPRAAATLYAAGIQNRLTEIEPGMVDGLVGKGE